jgi:hypothetical protein
MRSSGATGSRAAVPVSHARLARTVCEGEQVDRWKKRAMCCRLPECWVVRGNKKDVIWLSSGDNAEDKAVDIPAHSNPPVLSYITQA